MHNNIHKGTVVRWLKSYGFIQCPDFPDQEIFVHHRHIINMRGFRRFYEGDPVRFEVVDNGEKGLMATEAERVNTY